MAQLRDLRIEPRHWLYPSNVLSLLRFILVIPGYWFLVHHQYTPTLIMLIAVTASDILDGILARRFGQVSDLGKILDPLADKVAIVAGLVGLVLAYGLPAWLLLPVVVRDIFIVLGSTLVIRRRAFVPMSSILGKLTTHSVALVILVHLIRVSELIREVAIGLMLFMVGVSAITYSLRFYRLWKTPKG